VRYCGYRFSTAIISRCVWLYYRFNLSLRDIEELMAKDDITVSCETIRQWCRKFGRTFAERVRRRHAPPQDKWHCDALQLKMNGKTRYLWRAVDRDGVELDILVHHRRNAEAACMFLRRLLRTVGAVPRVVVTDKLRSYRAALAELLPQVEHRQHKGLNNRAENSHQPTRRRERGLQRCKSPRHAQAFLEPFGQIGNHFRPRRHLLTAAQYRQIRSERFRSWHEVTDVTSGAVTAITAPREHPFSAEPSVS
jgi:putative transposase